jgi:hypothetical protein
MTALFRQHKHASAPSMSPMLALRAGGEQQAAVRPASDLDERQQNFLPSPSLYQPVPFAFFLSNDPVTTTANQRIQKLQLRKVQLRS